MNVKGLTQQMRNLKNTISKYYPHTYIYFSITVGVVYR